MSSGLFLAYVDPWVNWDWVSRHVGLILGYLGQHVELTAIAVGFGLVIAVPLGVVAQRRPVLRSVVFTVFDVFYTIPSIAVFVFLIPYTGLSVVTAEIALVGYAVLILSRNVMVGLDAVPKDVLDAADGMGYRPFARLIRVELPLALPTIFAGLRIATVTTIGLVTVAALIGWGGLGQLILQGFIESFHTPLVVGMALSIALAFVADLGLAAVQRLALPWSRNG